MATGVGHGSVAGGARTWLQTFGKTRGSALATLVRHGEASQLTRHA